MRVLRILGISLAIYLVWVIVSFVMREPIAGLPPAQTFGEHAADFAGVAVGKLPDLVFILAIVAFVALAQHRISRS
jgi:hypothetical protein